MTFKAGLFIIFNVLSNIFCFIGVFVIFFISSQPRFGIALGTTVYFGLYFLTHLICKKWYLEYSVSPRAFQGGLVIGRGHKTHPGLVPLVFAVIYLILFIGDFYTDSSYLEMVHNDFNKAYRAEH